MDEASVVRHAFLVDLGCVRRRLGDRTSARDAFERCRSLSHSLGAKFGLGERPWRPIGVILALNREEVNLAPLGDGGVGCQQPSDAGERRGAPHDAEPRAFRELDMVVGEPNASRAVFVEADQLEQKKALFVVLCEHNFPPRRERENVSLRGGQRICIRPELVQPSRLRQLSELESNGARGVKGGGKDVNLVLVGCRCKAIDELPQH
ncbi:MAG TPA: hypothetical protein VF101_00945 [Gaiellaceae bacterium]